MTKFILPASLEPGDQIRIIAPSSPFSKEAFFEGIDILEAEGFQVVYDQKIFSKKGYLAGTTEVRANQFKKALQDKKSKAILFARGGYGSASILPHLKNLNKKNLTPKVVIGYSDITCLLTYLKDQLNWITYYGPVVAKDLHHKMDSKTKTSFLNTLTGQTSQTHQIKAAQILKSGSITAPMTGGCLTLLASLVGTPWQIKTENHILFLEDVNEQPYAVDRLITQLKLAGCFKKVKGVIFGSLSGLGTTKDYIQAIQNSLPQISGPVIFGFSAGHSKQKITLPFGIPVHISTAKKIIRIEE